MRQQVERLKPEFTGPAESSGSDLDLVLEGGPRSWDEQIAQLIVRTTSREYVVRSMQTGNTDVQFTCGLLGFSG